MLSELHIENVAIIEKADIEFGSGFNVMTGETGAGKSIVIDSIGAIIGSRTSRELVRTGAANAKVTAVFTDIKNPDWLEENGIEPDEDGSIFISRKISSDGKNTCRVNGTPVAVNQLREIGIHLLNIHGQNDGQHILNEELHREYLDSFGGLNSEVQKYRQLYDEYAEIKREISSLAMDEMEKERRVDSLKFQIEELESADIRVGEEAEHEQYLRRLYHNPAAD